jgi:hypothetical protein
VYANIYRCLLSISVTRAQVCREGRRGTTKEREGETGNAQRHTFIKERVREKNQAEIVTGLKADASPIRLIIVLDQES